MWHVKWRQTYRNGSQDKGFAFLNIFNMQIFNLRFYSHTNHTPYALLKKDCQKEQQLILKDLSETIVCILPLLSHWLSPTT